VAWCTSNVHVHQASGMLDTATNSDAPANGNTSGEAEVAGMLDTARTSKAPTLVPAVLLQIKNLAGLEVLAGNG